MGGCSTTGVTATAVHCCCFLKAQHVLPGSTLRQDRSCLRPSQQGHVPTGYCRPHLCRRSLQQPLACSSIDTNSAPQHINRRALTLFAASLALQVRLYMGACWSTSNTHTSTDSVQEYSCVMEIQQHRPSLYLFMI